MVEEPLLSVEELLLGGHGSILHRQSTVEHITRIACNAVIVTNSRHSEF